MVAAAEIDVRTVGCSPLAYGFGFSGTITTGIPPTIRPNSVTRPQPSDLPPALPQVNVLEGVAIPCGLKIIHRRPRVILTGLRWGNGSMALYLKAPSQLPVTANWAASFLLLGRQIAKYELESDRQLLICVSAPARDYIAWLIGVGWRLVREPDAHEQIEVSDSLTIGMRLNIASESRVWSGVLRGIDSAKGRINISGIWISISDVRAVAISNRAEGAEWSQRDIPARPTITNGSWLEKSWTAAHVNQDHEIALVGVKQEILHESKAQIGFSADSMIELGHLLTIPEATSFTAWCTTVVPATEGGMAAVDAAAKLVVLDGPSAGQWLRAVKSKCVVCIVDRSRENDPFEEAIARFALDGTLLDRQFLDWSPPPGIEIFGVEVLV